MTSFGNNYIVQQGGSPYPIAKKIFNNGGTLPIGTKDLYNNVTLIYLALVDKGVHPLAALELTNQKVAERGWKGFSTGDKKIYPDAKSFADHIVDWHGRMFPDSLKAKTFNDFWKSIQITPKYKYNSENPNYKNHLLLTRPGVKKRINFYRLKQGLEPLVYINNQNNTLMAKDGLKLTKILLK